MLISGGFYITRAIARPDGLGDALLPDRIFTLSECLTELVPDWWAIEWASISHEKRVAAVTKLGLPAESLPMLVRLATEAMASEELGWPCVWQSGPAAKAALARLQDLTSDFIIVELGVSAETAGALITELAPPPGAGETGLLKRLKVGAPLDERSVPLGWELLGVDHGGSYHSWLCNSIHEHAHQQLNIRPGPLALLTEHEARSVEKLIAAGIGAEPAQWFRGLLSRLD